MDAHPDRPPGLVRRRRRPRAVETCAALAGRALELALADLAARFGADPAGWRWGAAHPARMAHAVLGEQPLLAWLFDIDDRDRRRRHHGRRRPLLAARRAASRSRARHAASFRGLYDLADLARSRFVAATGQSGNPLSPHYRDLTRAVGGAAATVPMSRRGRGDRPSAAAPGLSASERHLRHFVADAQSARAAAGGSSRGGR